MDGARNTQNLSPSDPAWLDSTAFSHTEEHVSESKRVIVTLYEHNLIYILVLAIKIKLTNFGTSLLWEPLQRPH